MLWVYGHYNCCNSFSLGTYFRRQNLTSLKSVPVKRTDRKFIVVGVMRVEWSVLSLMLEVVTGFMGTSDPHGLR